MHDPKKKVNKGQIAKSRNDWYAKMPWQQRKVLAALV
jgi:hypothetical protein